MVIPSSSFTIRRVNQSSKFGKWTSFCSLRQSLLITLWLSVFIVLFIWQKNLFDGLLIFRRNSGSGGVLMIPKLRPFVFNLTDFGGVGDGRTVNTRAFERAILEISKLKNRGGGQLNVLDGYWLTAPFNLTSHMTLFLSQNAVILAIQDEKYWPLMPPLPSYGFGREHPGPRYGSLIHGQNLTDVTITGHNGTIDGQGKSWWDKFRQKRLNHTRGPLVQIMWSRDIRFSNITLQNSPFWTLHPYDCKNVFVTNVTILAPVVGAPNTDGIDPDSCENMVIEDCYISVGDDGVAIKSGWDQYGINYAKPSTNILIKNVVIRSMVSAGVSIGSEMSGGVSNVRVENLHVWSSRRGVRIKTSLGRGGYVRNITYRNIMFDNLRVGIVIKTDYNEHPDERYNHKAVPVIEDISFTGIYGNGVRVPVRLNGSLEIPVKNVVFRDMSVGITYKKKHIFQCAFVHGRVIGSVFPSPCENLDRYDEQGQLIRRSAMHNITNIDYDF